MRQAFYFFLLLGATQVRAELSLTWVNPGVNREQVFEVRETAGRISIHRNSNWTKEDDWRLGELRPKDSTAAQSHLKELETLRRTLADTQAQLLLAGTSFEALNSKRDLHSSYFVLNGIKVRSGSPLYEKLRETALGLQSLELVQVTGAELSADRKKIRFFENGAGKGEEAFELGFFCESASTPTFCRLRRWGILRLTERTNL